MAFNSLEEFIRVLEKEGELLRIKTKVNPHLEIAEITDRISKSNNNKALLFENTGTDFPLLINALGSERRMCLALGVHHLDDIKNEIETLFHTLSKPKNSILDKIKLLPTLSQFASWMPKVKSGRGACQEIIQKEININALPVLFCWPFDGGPFITLPVIHTKEPTSGIRNVGMYRMQLYDKESTGMHWHKHKVSAAHFNEYKKLGKKMPVAVTLGGDPVYTYAATAPLPENVDEYMLAGFLRKKKVKLVKCITQPEIEVPADADFVIEGYIDPSEDLKIEGPFGDHTGFYSLKDLYPVFHITCITHKKNAVYPATIVGIPPQEDAWIGKATERIFLAPIKMTMIPEIEDMNMPVEGVFHNLVIASIKKSFAGQAAKVMNAMWGAGQMMFNKILVVCDANDITNYAKLAQEGFKNFNPSSDLYLSKGPMDVLDHSCSKMGFGGKMCIDITAKQEEEQVYILNKDEFAMDKINNEFKNIDNTIAAINTQLLSLNIPVLIVSIYKKEGFDAASLAQKIFNHSASIGLKMVLILDQYVSIENISTSLWQLCNNMDAERDTIILSENKNGEHRSIAFMDGTRKRKSIDGFMRDWPNIIISKAETIKLVDEKWDQYEIGAFISSPSLQFQNAVFGQSAEVPVDAS